MKPDSWEHPETRQLLEDARALRAPLPEEEARLWRRIAQDTVVRRRNLAPALAFAAGLAATALVFWLRSPGPPESMLGPGVRLEVSSNAVLEPLTPPPGTKASARQVVLRSGRLQATVDKQPPGHQVAVITPHLRVVVVGTRFTVEVAGERSGVSVQEGRVRVESQGGQVLELGASESISSDDRRLLPAPPAPAAPTLSTCETVEGTGRVACDERLAQGNDLAAQNALYLLGLTAERNGDRAEALRRWESLADRFPEGVLTPEALLGALRLLVAEKRSSDALRVAARFQAGFAADGRLPEVLLVRAKLLCALPAHRAEAVPALHELVSAATLPAAIRQESLFALALCQRALGDRDAAASNLDRYLQEFPDGPHAPEVLRMQEEP